MKRFVVSNFDDFRLKAKQAYGEKLLPESVLWTETQTAQDSLFETLSESLPTPTLKRLTVPKAYMQLGETVEAHLDPQKWHHLYSLFLKIQTRGPAILEIDIDDDVRPLQLMAKQIKRDIHKMHAFVRFKKKVFEDEEFFTAWYEPDHRILRKAAPFFQRRFGAMKWIIATPNGVAYWNKVELNIKDKVVTKAEFDPGRDDFEEYWLTYFSNIFNPARIKIKAMKKEMPVRFWKNLPEAAVYDKLLSDAPARVKVMHDQLKKMAENDASQFITPKSEESEAQDDKKSLGELRLSAKICQGCPLYAKATQTVFGKGNAVAKVLLVGEQPGNEEDLKGEPFVGPAGKILTQSLIELGIDPESLYMTNAVKHFNFEQRGKLRLHQKPSALHIRACKPWLQNEISLIKPKLIICLGSTAAQSVFGFQMSVNKERGKFLRTAFCENTLVTFHPSYLLRIPNENQKRQATELFRSDLAHIKNFN